MPRSKQPRNVPLARQLRSEMSLPEVLLWRALRQQDEVRFRRQHPIGRYVLDFYCAKAKVAVEIDGIAHDTGTRPQEDVLRSEWLKAQGIEVVRIPARDVLFDPEAVAQSLVDLCRR